MVPSPTPVPQAEQFALDAPVPPARVLPCQLLHQRAHSGRDRRPTRRVRVSPFPLGLAAGATPAECPESRPDGIEAARAAAWPRKSTDARCKVPHQTPDSDLDAEWTKWAAR
jgi:hypothetical protein